MSPDIARGYIVGISSAIVGLIVRLCANRWAFGSGNHSWGPGSWESTDWAYWRHTYSDVGMTMLWFGLAILLICLHAQLRGARTTDQTESGHSNIHNENG